MQKLDGASRQSLLDNAARFERFEPLETFSWSTYRKSYESGSRVYLLAQGSEPRGIIASGIISTGEVVPDPHWNGDGSTLNYIDVQWDAQLFPGEVLPMESLEYLAPNTHWAPRRSGTHVDELDAKVLEEAWQAHTDWLGYGPLRVPRRVQQSPMKVTRGYREALTIVRRHQRAFRRLLLNNYENVCAYCGVSLLAILEAAHLVPDALGGESSVANGRLLCANHHHAFDGGLLEWNGESFSTVDPSVHVPPPTTRHTMTDQIEIVVGGLLNERGSTWDELGLEPGRLTLDGLDDLCRQLDVRMLDVIGAAECIIID